jgi:RNA polymerase sigma-70 factor (sigma-E family)
MVTRGDDFDDFVRGTSTRLLRTAVLLTGDRIAAEDLVQEVYERIYVRWRWIRGAPEAYARKALANLIANRWRQRGRKPEVALTEHHDRPTPDGTDRLADRDQLLTALQELPPRQRAVIVLRYYEDLTERQTAEALGCSVGTVKSQTSRGLDRLRTLAEPAILEGLK